MENISLHQWFDTPLGQFLLQREQRWLDASLSDVFGYHAVQLGLPERDLMRESRIPSKLLVNPVATPSTSIVAAFEALPIDAESIDLCVLPHALEFCANPHEILREVNRIMIPEGRIVIMGFNPWSLFGARRLFNAENIPWNGQFISLVQMKDWLSLLGFEVSSGDLACYLPPVQSQAWIDRLQGVERSAAHWLGVTGAVYMLQAVKRVEGMRLIKPKWASTAQKDRKLAAVARRRSKIVQVK
jgi:SAM-dependent methyltransferase